jgi:hypothetical protein
VLLVKVNLFGHVEHPVRILPLPGKPVITYRSQIVGNNNNGVKRMDRTMTSSSSSS